MYKPALGSPKHQATLGSSLQAARDLQYRRQGSYFWSFCFGYDPQTANPLLKPPRDQKCEPFAHLEDLRGCTTLLQYPAGTTGSPGSRLLQAQARQDCFSLSKIFPCSPKLLQLLLQSHLSYTAHYLLLTTTDLLSSVTCYYYDHYHYNYCYFRCCLSHCYDYSGYNYNNNTYY